MVLYHTCFYPVGSNFKTIIMVYVFGILTLPLFNVARILKDILISASEKFTISWYKFGAACYCHGCGMVF